MLSRGTFRTLWVASVAGTALATIAPEPAVAQEWEDGDAESENAEVVPFEDDTEHRAIVGIDGRSWITDPSDPHRCDAARTLYERVAELAARARSIPLPRQLRAVRTDERRAEQAEMLLRRWLHQMKELIEEINSVLVALHEQECAEPSVEALEALGSVYEHELREFDAIPVAPGNGLGCRMDPMSPLRWTAMDVDEACVGLAVRQHAFVPAVHRCVHRLVLAGRSEYALNELVPHHPWTGAFVHPVPVRPL